jgi:hypothetical protein
MNVYEMFYFFHIWNTQASGKLIMPHACAWLKNTSCVSQIRVQQFPCSCPKNDKYLFVVISIKPLFIWICCASTRSVLNTLLPPSYPSCVPWHLAPHPPWVFTLNNRMQLPPLNNRIPSPPWVFMLNGRMPKHINNNLFNNGAVVRQTHQFGTSLHDYDAVSSTSGAYRWRVGHHYFLTGYWMVLHEGSGYKRRSLP